jgi:hypothetical protein
MKQQTRVRCWEKKKKRRKEKGTRREGEQE